MLINNRLLAKISGTVYDWSIDLNNVYTGSKTIGGLTFSAGDRLYIGGDMPFNHRYIEVSTVNAIASVASIELWNGKAWKAALDTTDYTDVSGVSLAATGILQWTPDRDESWQLQSRSQDISDLSTTRIYDMYWAKISFSADLTPGTALKYVGHRFSNESDMGGRYPELLKSATKLAFSSGRTTWNDVLVEASEVVVRDLRKQRLIVSPGQILGWELFTEAATHKAAELIFNAFGESQEDKKGAARTAYDEALSAVAIGGGIDQNADGKLSRDERYNTVGLMRR
jgi:hypothetical protein